MAVDGYLNFDTKISTKGFDSGLKSMTKSFVGSAADMKAAADMVINSLSRIAASFRQITDAYRPQIESEARLGATMRNSTDATEKQIQSVKELASSLQEIGVVGDEVQLAGAQELATYVSTTESIKKMLPVMDDMIAQQYGYSASTDSAVTIATMLGKVLQGQTSALSRYGYKFDEAQEKILKYGTEQERVATLAAVIEESVSGVNSALADTPTGKVKQLENDFGDLKETMGQLLTEVVYPVVTYLDVVVKKLNSLFSAASGGIKSVFGIKDSDVSFGGSTSELADSSAETADNYEDIAKNAQKAEKANKGSLAAFDELNVIAQEDDEDEEGQAANVLPVSIPDTAEVNLTPNFDTSEIESKVDRFFEIVKSKFEKLKTVSKPLIDSFKRLKTVLDPFSKTIGSGLKWFYDNVMKKFAKWVVGEGLPAFIDMLSGFFKLVDKVGSLVGDVLKSIWDNFFSKVADFVGDAIVKFLETIGQVFSDIADSPDAVTALVVISEVIGTIIAALVLIPAALKLIPLITGGIKIISALFSGLPVVIAAVANPIGLIITLLIAIGVVIVEIIAYKDTLIEFGHMVFDYWSSKIKEVWNNLKTGAKTAWEAVKTVFGKVGQFFGDVFSAAWEKVKEIFSKGGAIFHGIKEGIVEAFKAVVNSLIDGINAVVRIPFDGINTALNVLRSVDIAGHMPFEWLPEIPVPEIPHLAQGTVIPANYGEFAAILGDNKRETEIVSPVSAMKQAFIEALAESGIIGRSAGANGDIVIQIDGKEVFRAVRDQADDYSRTHGGRPAFGGA